MIKHVIAHDTLHFFSAEQAIVKSRHLHWKEVVHMIRPAALSQEDLKRGHVQQHRTELQRQIAAHEEAAQAERAARAAEARSIQVTLHRNAVRPSVCDALTCIGQCRSWPLACR